MRPGGGVSRPRVLSDGPVIERAAVNFTHTEGANMPPAATERRPELAGRRYEAVSISLIVHIVIFLAGDFPCFLTVPNFRHQRMPPVPGTLSRPFHMFFHVLPRQMLSERIGYVFFAVHLLDFNYIVPYLVLKP